MKLDKETEEKLKSEAVKYLKDGRPNWDIPHTFDTVYWMKKLIEKEGGDERILVSAMYLHDVGFPKLKKGYDFDNMMKHKKGHDKKSAELAEQILKKLDYSDSEIKEIIYLVGEHYAGKDKKETFSHNFQLVIEADGLAKIDWERVTPNFDKENCLKYLEYFKGRNVDKFKTETGKKFLKILLEKAEKYWN